MTSQTVATAAALSTDPAGRYPAAKPATAPAVPHTSASPNRARHACHHPLVLGWDPSRRAGGRPAVAPPVTAVLAPVGTSFPRLNVDSVATEAEPPVLPLIRPRAAVQLARYEGRSR